MADTNNQIRRIAQAARQERKVSPATVQKTKATRHSPGGASERRLAEVTVAISYTGAQVYTVQKIDDSGTKDGMNITIDELITDANGSSPAAVDMREYFPWFAAGDVVEIFQSSIDTTDKWYFAEAMTFIGSGTVNSLAVVEDTGRLKAVWV